MSFVVTDLGTIPESPTHPITEIDTNIFVDIDINTTKIDIETSIEIAVHPTTSQHKAKNMTKLTTADAISNTAPTSLVEFQLEAQQEYTKLLIIVTPIGILILLTGITVGIVLTCLIANRSFRVEKSMEIGDNENINTDNIQDQELLEVQYCTV